MAMISLLAQRRQEVEALCRRYHVRRLEVLQLYLIENWCQSALEREENPVKQCLLWFGNSIPKRGRFASANFRNSK
jgi:hypothetical protein